MIDPAETWNAIWPRSLRHTRDFLIATLGADFDPNLFNILAVAPVIENAGYFELHPAPQRAAKRAWRCIITVRANLLHADLREAGTEETCRREAIDGIDIVDLVACSLDLQLRTARAVGMADVLGCPTEPGYATVRVRIHATPLAWLRAGCRGVTLVGDDLGAQQWLRGCTPGLVVNSIRLGEAIIQKMRREIPPLPPVLVAE